MILKSKSNLLEKLVPILLVASIGLAFAVGMLWQKVQNMEGGRTTRIAGLPAQAGTQAGNPQAAGAPSFGNADQVDKLRPDDHIRGDKTARMLLIEYSDLECPF